MTNIDLMNPGTYYWQNIVIFVNIILFIMRSEFEIQQEITPLDNDDFFIILNRPDAKFDYAVHWHPDYEINMVINSYGTRVVGDSKEDFDNLDIVIIGPKLPHIWNGMVETGNHVVTIQFHENFVNWPIVHKRVFSSILALLNSSGRGITFDNRETKEEIRNRILELTLSSGIESATGFLSLLDFMGRAKDQRPLASVNYQSNYLAQNTHSRRISAICNYVTQNYNEQIKLSDISELVNMSESAFCHFFKKKTGKKFVDYLNDVRIGQASKMLYETTDSISEICYSCGFNNTSNFIRVFKKKHGETPSEYREKMQHIFTKY